MRHFAHGFARARCDDCGHDYFVPSSCKGRGVCPSCNTRRMVDTAAHLTDHVFPRLPMRHWVLWVPKRLRYFMQRDGAVLNMVLRIFLRVIAQTLQTHSPGAAHVDTAALHIGAVAFIHRFGSSLNGHEHFHVCVVDGVFEEMPGVGDTDAQSTPPGIVFHPASAIDETAVAQVQTDLRRRILRAFVGRDLLESCDDKHVTKVDQLHLTPPALLARIAARVPPPCRHRPSKSWCRPSQPPRASARMG